MFVLERQDSTPRCGADFFHPSKHKRAGQNGMAIIIPRVLNGEYNKGRRRTISNPRSLGWFERMAKKKKKKKPFGQVMDGSVPPYNVYVYTRSWKGGGHTNSRGCCRAWPLQSVMKRRRRRHDALPAPNDFCLVVICGNLFLLALSLSVFFLRFFFSFLCVGRAMLFE